MKIAIITAELPYPSNSGGRKYTWSRIKELNMLGNEIILYSFKEKGEVVEKDKLLKYCSEVYIYERNKSIYNILRNFSKPYSALTRINSKLKKNLNDTSDLDIIIVDMPQLIYNLPRTKKVPIVLTQHNIEYKTFKNIGDRNKNIIKKFVFNIEAFKLFKLECKLYKSELVDLFTFISVDDKKFFEKKFKKNNSILIPYGYNISNKKYISKRKKRIVFTGKMDYQPNNEAVLWFAKEIWPIIKESNNDVEFYVVGKNPSEEIIKLRGEDLIVTGMVESIEEFIDTADIIVIPLLSGGGVKIKLIEALGRENIVISTSKGVEGTIFENNKHLLIEDNSTKFARKCIEVLNNTNKFKYLSENAIKIIEEKYSWKSISKIYEKNLYTVVNKYKK